MRKLKNEMDRCEISRNQETQDRKKIFEFSRWLMQEANNRMLEAYDEGKRGWDDPKNSREFKLRSIAKFEIDPLDSLILHAIWFWHYERI